MIVAIIEKSTNAIEEFRNEESESEALSKFCNSVTPSLNSLDYLAINTQWPEKSDNLQKSWHYNPANQSIERVFNKYEFIKKIIAHRDYKLSNKVFLEYPESSGILFSCSEKTQLDFLKISILDAKGLASYPLIIYSADKLDNHSILDSVELNNFLGLLYNKVMSERILANTHIDSVKASSSIEEAQLVIDGYLNT